jgi:hypothetical protein
MPAFAGTSVKRRTTWISDKTPRNPQSAARSAVSACMIDAAAGSS